MFRLWARFDSAVPVGPKEQDWLQHQCKPPGSCAASDGNTGEVEAEVKRLVPQWEREGWGSGARQQALSLSVRLQRHERRLLTSLICHSRHMPPRFKPWMKMWRGNFCLDTDWISTTCFHSTVWRYFTSVCCGSWQWFIMCNNVLRIGLCS